MNREQLSLPLNTGGRIPKVGLGVWQAPTGVAQRAVESAIRVGYRHVDTARVYGNEGDVGAAVRASAVPRAELFITTKLWNDAHGYDAALRAFDESQKRLGLDYVDLYLIHWPVESKRAETWRALEQLYQDGRARAIGVSNYLVPHILELLSYAKVPPAVNQIQVTPFLQQRDTRELCTKHGIVVEAYSPLTRGERMSDPRISAVANRVGRTNAQVMLRWGVQSGMVVLPKTVTESRMVENAALFDFELDPAAMDALDSLEEGFLTHPGWDPRKQR